MTERMQTAALIERYYAAFNAADWAGMAALLTEDVRHDVNQGGARVGRETFEAFSAHMARCYREQLSEIVVMASDDGARGAAEFIVDGVYQATDDGLPPASGQTYRLSAGAFFDVVDGRIARVTTYYNLKDWIAQVGG